MRFSTMWYVRPAKAQTSLRIRAVYHSLCLSHEYSMALKILTEHDLEFLSLKGDCTGSSESVPVNMRIVRNLMSRLIFPALYHHVFCRLARVSMNQKVTHTACNEMFLYFLIYRLSLGRYFIIFPFFL